MFRSKTVTFTMPSLGYSSAEQNLTQWHRKIAEFLLGKSLRILVRSRTWPRDQETYLLLHLYHGIQWDHRSGHAFCHEILLDPGYTLARFFVAKSGAMLDLVMLYANCHRNQWSFAVGSIWIMIFACDSPTCTVAQPKGVKGVKIIPSLILGGHFRSKDQVLQPFTVNVQWK